MQGMEQRLIVKIDGVEEKLTRRIDNLEVKIDSLEVKVDNLEVKVDRNHAQTMVAFDNMDARLDDLEVVQVPKLKKAVGMR